MNQEPDNYDPYELRYTIGFVPWWVAFGVPLLILIATFLHLTGCTYNRNAPLINVQDSANGNTTTVPLVGQ